jgi:uncharacterized coiled-coil DUF342 family protein
MLLLDRKPGTKTPRGGDADQLNLRFRADGRLVELPLGKTTIGSSLRCDLRIERPGVAPVHCLIVRGAEGLTVRRWAVDTRLNGVPFDESELSVGDCLSIGHVELDVIGPQATKQSAAPVNPSGSSDNLAAPIRTEQDRATNCNVERLSTLQRETAVPGDLHLLVANLEEDVPQTVSERNRSAEEGDSAQADAAATGQQSVEQESSNAERQELAKQSQSLEREDEELAGRFNQLVLDLGKAIKDRKKLADDQAVLDTENHRLRERNSQLQTQLSELTILNTVAGGERDELRHQIAQLQADLHAAVEDQARSAEDYAALHAERDELRRHNEVLRAEKQSLDAEKTAIAAERADVCGERDDLRRQNALLQAGLHAVTEEKAKSAEDYAALHAERDDLRRHNESLLSETQALAAAKTAIAAERADLVGQCDELRGQIERLRNESQVLADGQKALARERTTLCAERDELRRKVEELRAETKAIGSERAVIADERTTLYRERNELRQQCEELRAHVGQLHEEASALAVAKLAALDERDTFCRQNEQLQTRIAELTEENSAMTADKNQLSDEQARLRTENSRLEELEREMQAAVSDRENTSAELYRALLQLAELQERDDHNKALVAAYESLNEEHQQLIQKADELHRQINRMFEERKEFVVIQESLSDEAAARSESHNRIAVENAQLLESLAEVRQQLNQAQHDQVALAGTITELQRELGEKRQAEAAIQQDQAALTGALAELERELAAKQLAAEAATRAMATAEQKLAEQAHQFAESISQLEDQLAAADDARNSLAGARDESERRLAEAERQSAERLRRIAELEAQFATAQVELEAFADRVANPPAVEAVESLSEHNLPPGGVEAVKFNPSSPGTWPAGNCRGPSLELACPTIDGATQTSDASVDPGASPAESVAGGSGSNSNSGVSAETTVAPPVLSVQPSADARVVAEVAPQTTPTVSYIERYSHLFADEPVCESRPAAPAHTQASALISAKSRTTGLVQIEGGCDVTPTSDNEESIEQYMAKLFQRVRGDSPAVAGPSPSAAVLNGTAAGAGTTPAAVPPVVPPATPSSSIDSAEEADVEVPVNWEALARRAAAPTTDLGALRALANESARRAIGRHELKVHRADAVTKLIVSTLAGMTSLWLMLDAPNWLDTQFIAACIALIVAAYWAGEAGRAMLESFRAAAYDGAAGEDDGLESHRQSALPIDIDASR